jgi:hypothetical protein
MSGRVVNLDRDELVDAEHVLDDLAVAGVAVEAVDGRLRLRPASNVSAALAARVRLHKPAVLELLASRPPLVDLAEDCRQLVKDVAESLRLPPDVLVAETVEQARERQAAAIERLRLDRLAYVEDARRAGVYRGLAINTEGGVG